MIVKKQSSKLNSQKKEIEIWSGSDFVCCRMLKLIGEVVVGVVVVTSKQHSTSLIRNGLNKLGMFHIYKLVFQITFF